MIRPLPVSALALALAFSTVGARATPPQVTYDVYAIRYGTLPQFRVAGLIAGADTSRRMDIALMIWLLKGSDGRVVLVDAGFQRKDLIDRWEPVDYVLPSVALGRMGVTAESVTDVVVSHVHWDHFDGANLFPNARIWLQRDEVAHHLDTLTGRSRNRALDGPDAAMLDSLMKRGRVTLVDGDAKEILSGITVYTGGKHTFQSQAVAVRMGSGTAVLASDNVYLYENIDTRRPIAQTLDSVSNVATQRRLLTIASEPSLLVPGHDPAVFTRFRTVAPGVVQILPSSR